MNNDQNSQFEHGTEHTYRYVFSSGEITPSIPPKRHRTQRGAIHVIVTLVLCAAISFGAGFGGALFGKYYLDISTEEQSDADLLHDSPESITNKATSNVSLYGSAGEDVFAPSDVVRMVEDAVVVIDVYYQSYKGYSQSGTGSGVIISPEGYIITCNHVVEDADKICVVMNSGQTYEAALVGNDETSDLAVIHIDAGERELPYVKQGCSADLVVGESVVAIGNPLGLGLTATTGIISATEREIATSDGSKMTLLQTDTAINSGNSGGGLFNLDGQLVGIVNAKYSASGVEGLAFAIPIDSAYEVQTQLIKYGYVRGVVDHGLTLLEVTQANLVQASYFYQIRQTGLYIYQSEYTQDLQAFDRIVSLDGVEISSSVHFEELMGVYRVGDTVTVGVQRNGKYLDISLTLKEYVPDRLKG